MRTRAILLVGLLASLTIAASANAAPKLVDIEFSAKLSAVTTTTPPYSGCPCPGGDAIPPGAFTKSNGVAEVTGSAPAAFTIRAGTAMMNATLTVTNPPNPSAVSYISHFVAENGAGAFQASGGPGLTGGTPVTYAPQTVAGPAPVFSAGQFRVGFQGGSKAFGGTMRILGSADTQVTLILTSIGPGTLMGTIPLPLSAIGGPTGYSQMQTGTFVHATATSAMQPLRFSTDFTFFGWDWTTGTVSAVATPGYVPTVTSAMGTDNRTPTGKGTIQLVTPFVYSFNSLPFGDVGGFASTWKVNIEFLPEPRSALAIGAGFTLLGVLYRLRRP